MEEASCAIVITSDFRRNHMPVKVLTWNLFHGRSVPPAERSLLDEFSGRIAGWEWDVALLQEVPPWWPQLLANSARAQWRLALTSRNAGLPLRRAIAQRWPDLMKSNGGGCNAILARRGIVEHRSLRLRTWPERRVAQLVRLSDGLCVVNFHASTRPDLAREEIVRLVQSAGAWAKGEALVLGGDLNMRQVQLPLGALAPLEEVAASTVDFLFAQGLQAVGPEELLDRRVGESATQLKLSDHQPLAVTLEAEPTAG